jgi:hypothetical protein
MMILFWMGANNFDLLATLSNGKEFISYSEERLKARLVGC